MGDNDMTITSESSPTGWIIIAQRYEGDLYRVYKNNKYHHPWLRLGIEKNKKDHDDWAEDWMLPRWLVIE
jgi:hypothetical protein